MRRNRLCDRRGLARKARSTSLRRVRLALDGLSEQWTVQCRPLAERAAAGTIHDRTITPVPISVAGPRGDDGQGREGPDELALEVMHLNEAPSTPGYRQPGPFGPPFVCQRRTWAGHPGRQPRLSLGVMDDLGPSASFVSLVWRSWTPVVAIGAAGVQDLRNPLDPSSARLTPRKQFAQRRSRAARMRTPAPPPAAGSPGPVATAALLTLAHHPRRAGGWGGVVLVGLVSARVSAVP